MSVQKTEFVTTADDLLVHDVDDGVGTVEDVGLHSRCHQSMPKLLSRKHGQRACNQSYVELTRKILRPALSHLNQIGSIPFDKRKAAVAGELKLAHSVWFCLANSKRMTESSHLQIGTEVDRTLERSAVRVSTSSGRDRKDLVKQKSGQRRGAEKCEQLCEREPVRHR